MDCEELLTHISDALLLLDSDGYITYCNPAVQRVTGYTPAELAGKHIATLYATANDKIKAEYELSRAARAGTFTNGEWKLRKDGTRYWGDVTLTCIGGDTKPVRGYTCTLKDTTEQKKEEIALRSSEERYRLMVNSVRDYAIFLLDPHGHIVTWNEGARRIKGYATDEITGKHFSTFYTAEDLESKKPERELKIAIATGKYEEEGWRVRKNGTVFWANVVITALYDHQNRLVGFSKVTRDLTERKQNEEALKQSEEQYRSLVEQVTDYGIFMMDEAGRIISWNEGARRISGYDAGDIIGKYFSIFYPEEELANNKPATELKIAKATGKYEEEGWRLRKDGTRFWASIVITAVYNAAGLLIGYSKVTRDLTERKEAERALRESYERYRTLADTLKHTNDELTEANRELEQFTSIVSHDLQEPIRTVQSFLQLIARRLNEQRYEDVPMFIEKTVTAATRMRELIYNLLSYSQIGRAEGRLEPVSMNELLNQAMQNLKSALDASGAEVTIQNDVDVVAGDKVQLVQLMQNLVGNAIKFTDAHHPRVAISCGRTGNKVQCSVTDNGIGIASEDVPKIFEVFKRLHTDKEFPGTGIGLAICKKIVDRHGGNIWVESEHGKGTTFHFTLQEQSATT